MNQTFGILAHVDAGKTTLSERILFRAGAIRSCGRVDKGDTYLDDNRIERARGITVFTGLAHFCYEDCEYDLLDTPGHADFSAEMERAVQAMDYAILVVSAVEGVQGHTVTIWRILQQANVPTWIFINKTDRQGADCTRVMQEIHRMLTPDAVWLEQSEACAEAIAERDDALLEQYLSGTCTPELLERTLCELIADRRIFPCMAGSALQDIGIEELMRAFRRLTRERIPDQPRAFRIRRDPNGTRLTFYKVGRQPIKAKSLFEGEKINEVRLYHGEKYITVQSAPPGCICAVTGLTRPLAYGGECQPILRARVESDEPDVRKVLHMCRILEEEDPALQVQWNEETQEITIGVMGKVQLEVLCEIAQERFGIPVTFGTSTLIYRETIAAPAPAFGHFEPLRHYAEVHLWLEPGARGSGLTFRSALSTDVLDAHWQNLIRTHLLEREHKGVLTGSPLTDVCFVLANGRDHLKHTEGGDFRQATWRAVRQGLMGADNILLEPVYAFRIQCEVEQLGRILSDLTARHCETQPPEIGMVHAVVSGHGPASDLIEYPTELTDLTRGKGSITLRLEGWQECHNTEEVIARIGYEPERDTEQPMYSIFCSHGAGYPVAWQDVPQAVHCEKRPYAQCAPM